MASIIKIKRSETASSIPTTSDIAVGEIALNTADRKIYVRDSSNSIIEVANADSVSGGSGSSLTNGSATFSLSTDGTLTLNTVGYIYDESVDFTTTTSNQTLDTFTTTQYRTVKYFIQAHSGADIHATELLVSHDGISAYTSITNTVYSDISLISLSASISSGTITIAVTPTYENTTVDFVRISMTGSTLDTAFDFEGDLQTLGGSDIDLQSDTGDAVDLAGTFAGDLQTQSGSVDLSSSELVGSEDLNV